jgi:diketogulonate reductase-like aldo/keto reductase
MMPSPFNPSRRQHLRLVGAGFAALSLSKLPMAHATDSILRTIAKTGEALPVIGLGTYQAFDVGNDAQERALAKKVLQRFAELGGEMVDSSPMYGSAETVVGDLASELKLQSSLFIATKVWTSGRDAGIRQMEDSLRKLKRERIELMQIHNLLDAKTHLATLKDWKKSGKIKYLGVTHYHAGAYAELEQAIKGGEMDFVQLNYSITEREAETRLLNLAKEVGTAVIVNRPFAQGGLFSRTKDKPLPDWAAEFDCKSWAQFFLKYIVSHPAVTCVIPATRNVKHLADNMGASMGRLPDEKTRKKMVEYFQTL